MKKQSKQVQDLKHKLLPKPGRAVSDDPITLENGYFEDDEADLCYYRQSYEASPSHRFFD